MSSGDAPTIAPSLRLASQHHEAGRLSEAEQLYLGILRTDPGHPDANHALGVLLAQRGVPAQGLAYLEVAVGAQPDESRYWPTYAAALLSSSRPAEALKILEQGLQRGLSGPVFDGLLSRAQTQCGALAAEADRIYAAALHHHQRGEIGQAVALYRSALVLAPQRMDAQVNLANALAAQGQFADAIAAYHQAIVIDPGSAEVRNNLGNVLAHLGKQDEAVREYRQALALCPTYADALYNLGIALEQLGRTGEAIASYREALAVKPDFAKAHHNLATALCAIGETEAGFASFTRHAELAFGADRPAPTGSVPAHKERHDREQSAYLGDGAEGRFRLTSGERLATPAINSANAVTVAEKWQSTTPQIVVIDNFLTEPALEKLRRFCWESTVWRRAYKEGYLGAMAEYGFACPLLAQIAEEMRDIFPAMIGAHPLRYLWGFKYDSQQSGINVHADRAAVNVNFWITPDDANLDPESGGLVVWDIAAPLDWEPGTYNGDVAASREFLARSGARPVTIPYRANRAVAFDSDLFHETDKFTFRDGYLNRRINITLLYGDRES